LAHYEEALALEPGLVEARIGTAVALTQLRRYQDARDRLIRDMQADPDQPAFAHGLARVLAAAPDDRVRDGPRAMALVQELLQHGRTLDLGETMAMTLAELGQYQQAASVQRDLLAAAQKSGLGQSVPRLSANLELYEAGRPCRTPWAPDELP
jgi:tetratricopeptide (TPR) repeat protein